MNPKSSRGFRTTIKVLALVLLAIGLTACGLFGGQEEPEPTPVLAVQQPNVVSAEAFVVPLQEADLAFEGGGRVVSIEIEEGDTVSKGQMLAKLDDSAQQASLANAEANLAQVQAQVETAKARLAEAQANLAKVKAGATPEEIAQAEANVAKAEAALAELLANPTAEDIAQAEASVETAQARLAQVLAGTRDEDLQAAASSMLQAEAKVRLAQADYDKFVYGEPNVAEPYGVALQQATLEYERAQAEYNKLLNGATDEEIAVARAQLREAEAALDKVLAGATAEQIAQTQAEVVRSEQSLAQLEAGATDEDIAVAEAGVGTAKADVEAANHSVAQAEANKKSAQVEVDKTNLTAPFDGTISAVNIDPGEIVQTGATIMSLGDTSRWQIETDDLTEIDIVGVQEGAKVQISVDALPGEEFEGTVVRITPKSETKAGDVTYTVLIDITKGDTSRLRWGMTTFVDIEVEPEL